MVIFVGLILLLKKFAWKPILDAVNDREEGIKNALLAAENAKKDMQNLKADNEKLLAEARAERDLMIKEAREIKEKMIADAKSEAQAQGEKMIDQAKASIESEKNAAMAELKNQVSSLSLEIAEKLLQDELSNKEAQTKLVEKMLGDAKLN
jgi:F-type H+-transporting ATPase subunit b